MPVSRIPPWLPWALFGLVCFGAATIAQLLLGPLSRTEVHLGRAAVACAAIVLVPLYAHLRTRVGGRLFVLRGPRATQPFSAPWFLMLAMAVVVTVGVQNYYHFAPVKTVSDGVSSLDTGYHYLNGKYFRELGYNDLYPAVLIADEVDGEGHLTKIKSYRNLETDRYTSRDTAFDEEARIRSQFGDRWEEFSHDTNFLVGKWSSRSRKYFFTDHGFNAPPTWVLFGGALSNLVGVEKVAIITSVDFLVLGGALVLVGMAFGLDAVAWCLIFFAACFAGRWPIVGVNLLRHDWIAATLACVALLRMKRPGWAGVSLAVAAWSRIFPGILIVPWVFFVFANVASTRGDERRAALWTHARFLLGGIAASVVLLAAVSLIYGPGVLVDFWGTLKLHARLDGYNVYKSGFGDFLVYEGELHKVDMRASGGLTAKRRALQAWQPWVRGTAVVTLAIIGAWVVSQRRRLESWEVLPLGILPFFILTNPQVQYFNIRYLLFVYHFGRDEVRARDVIGVVLLLATEVAANYSQYFGNIRYASTSITSLGITLYWGVQLVFMIFETLSSRRPDLAAPLARKPLLMAILAGGLATGVFGHYWSLGTPLGRAKVVSSASLRRVRESGTHRNDKGVLRFSRTFYVTMGRKPRHDPWVDVSMSRKDRYTLEFLDHELRPVGEVEVRASKRQRKRGRGLQRRVFEVPETATSAGYEYVRVVPSGLAKRYRLGHLRLSAKKPNDD